MTYQLAVAACTEHDKFVTELTENVQKMLNCQLAPAIVCCYRLDAYHLASATWSGLSLPCCHLVTVFASWYILVSLRLVATTGSVLATWSAILVLPDGY